MQSVHVLGVGMTPLGKFPNLSVKDLTRTAVELALNDAACATADVDAVWFSNTRQGFMEGQNGIRGECALFPLGFQGLPIVNVENACASGSTAMREALAHIRAGMCDVALVVGADKMYFPELKDRMFRAFLGGTDVHEIEATRQRLLAIAGEGARAPSDVAQFSFFMEMYASFAQLHMRLYGTTDRQIALAAAKNHNHSTLNPLSQYRHAMTVEQVLSDPMVVPPLTRAMCAPISDGAAAVVVCSERGLHRLGGSSRAVRLRAISLATARDRKERNFDGHIGAVAAASAYEEAGIGPKDVGVAEVHDACSFAEILQSENLGFCSRGDGGRFVESGHSALGGKLPINPSGGLVSKGHPVGATGLIQLHELVTQLRSEAGARQVPGVRVAVAENGGGFLGVEEAVTTVTVLSKD